MRILLLIVAAITTCTLCACGAGAGPTVAGGPAGQATSTQAGKSGEGSGGVLLAYSQCMRKNGVANFPDLSGTVITPQTLQGEGIDTNSAAYHHAAQACRHFLTGGSGGGSSVQSAAVLAFAQCMRKNGISNFPDPVMHGSSMSISLKGTGITTQSPVFQNALLACEKDLRKNSGTGGGS